MARILLVTVLCMILGFSTHAQRDGEDDVEAVGWMGRGGAFVSERPLDGEEEPSASIESFPEYTAMTKRSNCRCPYGLLFDRKNDRTGRSHSEAGCYYLEGARDRGRVRYSTHEETGIDLDDLKYLPEGNCDKYKCKTAAYRARLPYFCFTGPDLRCYAGDRSDLSESPKVKDGYCRNSSGYKIGYQHLYCWKIRY